MLGISGPSESKRIASALYHKKTNIRLSKWQVYKRPFFIPLANRILNGKKVSPAVTEPLSVVSQTVRRLRNSSFAFPL